MECKWLVDVLKQPKKKQQHRAHLGHCGDFIDCTMILFTYASYKQANGWESEWTWSKKSGIHWILTVEDVTECALWWKGLGVFVSLPGAHGAISNQKSLRNNWFKMFVEPRTSVHAARPELLLPNLNSLRRICASSRRRTPASPITEVGSSMPNSNKPSTVDNKCDIHMLGSLAGHIKCESPFVVHIPLRGDTGFAGMVSRRHIPLSK